ncbi:MAG: tRNA (adenosine(37)-N6)-threonylcarbamoyltransferase complex dimerization subunit type 1 TsaB [Deltaproteobacteria bacterium]|nr:tRNA (adenosine(37)-N6)-threonylcarbamoyltransferase complex dimerization subunit type 1 TsaB [Deltaproteobacteria bacterium]MBW2658713.1 tRNA (adenosine(37)-N6)-threonylcarbamoyltransferase complex dimerization subunit type 1 TsaB [Deltaproteobacteria bacterium]
MVLSIDTATPCSSVALTIGTRMDGEILASLSLSSGRTHSRRLLALVDYLMEETGVGWSRIDAVAVSLGPGSFTGLRIGMATAKGLAFAADKPLVGISTLDGLASKCAPTADICAVLDARKKEVYAAFFRTNEAGLTVPTGVPMVITPEKLSACLPDSVVMVGDGVRVYGQLWKKLSEGGVQFAPSQMHEPAASSLGFIAKEMLERGEVLNVAEAVPLYIRASDAELNLSQKKKGNRGK